MNRAVWALAGLLFLWPAGSASAQAFLDQIEKQVQKDLMTAGAGQVAPPAAGGAAPRPEAGYLGIITDDRQDRGRGVRILQVHPGSPGEKAGLRAQDLITGLGGVRVRQMTDLAPIFEQVSPDGRLLFDIVRGEQRLQLEVTFGRRPVAAPADVILPPAQGAAAPPAATIDTKIESLERRIRELELRIERLERAAQKAGS